MTCSASVTSDKCLPLARRWSAAGQLASISRRPPFDGHRIAGFQCFPAPPASAQVQRAGPLPAQLSDLAACILHVRMRTASACGLFQSNRETVPTVASAHRFRAKLVCAERGSAATTTPQATAKLMCSISSLFSRMRLAVIFRQVVEIYGILFVFDRRAFGKSCLWSDPATLPG